MLEQKSTFMLIHLYICKCMVILWQLYELFSIEILKNNFSVSLKFSHLKYISFFRFCAENLAISNNALKRFINTQMEKNLG